MPFLVRLRASPGASKDAVGGAWQGPDGPRLVVRVTAPADDGRANRAVESVLASAFGLPRSAVTIVSGDRNRLKTVALDGADHAQLQRRLEELLKGTT